MKISDEALIIWAATGHKAVRETNTWYCRVATDGSTTAYGGWCVLSSASRPYDNPAWGIATTAPIYFLLAVVVFGSWMLRKSTAVADTTQEEQANG